jgi:hypothetical protein
MIGSGYAGLGCCSWVVLQEGQRGGHRRRLECRESENAANNAELPDDADDEVDRHSGFSLLSRIVAGRTWLCWLARRCGVKGRQAVGRDAAPRFLETTVALEKKFLEGRQNRVEELESAVRTIDPEDLELFRITDSPQEAVETISSLAYQNTNGEPV